MNEQNNLNTNDSQESIQQPVSNDEQKHQNIGKKIFIKVLIVIFVVLAFCGISFASYKYYQNNIKHNTKLAVVNKQDKAKDITVDKIVEEDIVAEENETQGKTCPPVITDDNIATDENSDEVVTALYRALTTNDYDYIIDHTYCDEVCQKAILNELGLCLDEFWELSKKISESSKYAKIIELTATLNERTENMAKYDVKYKFTHLESDGQEQGAYFSGEKEYELIKVGKRWKIDLGKDMKYKIVLLSHYQAMFDDLDKCGKKEPIEYTAPISGGQLVIDESDHPLNGFKIDFPKLKEPLKVKISCMEKYPPYHAGIFHVTLPISIEFNKDPEILSKEQLELSEQILRETDDFSFSLYSQVQFQYTLPYYDIGFNEESGFAHTQVANDIGAISKKWDTLYPTKIADAKNNLLSAQDFTLHKIVFADASMESLKSKKKDLSISSVDIDNDGVADHIENIFNIDKNKKDTDGDGYLDGEEIINGYNPAGSDKILVDEPNLENKILYSISTSTRDITDNISRWLSCLKIYSYDIETNENQEIINNANSYFYLSPDHKKIIYINTECNVDINISEEDIIIFDLATNKKEISDNRDMIGDRLLWKDIWLQRKIDMKSLSEDYSLGLYNQALDKKSDINSFSGTALMTYLSKNGNYLFCSGRANSYRIDILKDKIDKEYDFNTGIMYVSPDSRQLFYLKREKEDLANKIYVYDDQMDTSRRLTNLDDNYQELINLQTQTFKKLLFNAYQIDLDKAKDIQIDYQIGIYDPETDKIDYIKEEGMPMNTPQDENIIISPDGNNIAYFDTEKKKLVVFNLSSKSITKEIAVSDKPDYMIWY